MRYFFHVSDGTTTIADDFGSVLSGPGVAMVQAALIAAELAGDAMHLIGFEVCVVDERGAEIGQVPIPCVPEGPLH